MRAPYLQRLEKAREKAREEKRLAREAAGLPPWGAMGPLRAKKTLVARETRAREATSRPPGARTAPSAPDPAPTPQTHGVRQCWWIEDEDYIRRIRSGGVPWTCLAEAVSLKPYCEEHQRRAHVPRKRKKNPVRKDPVEERIAARREIAEDEDTGVVLVEDDEPAGAQVA